MAYIITGSQKKGEKKARHGCSFEATSVSNPSLPVSMLLLDNILLDNQALYENLQHLKLITCCVDAFHAVHAVATR